MADPAAAPPDVLEVSITLTRDDYWEFNKHLMRKQFGGSLFSRWKLFLALTGVMVALACTLTVLRGDLGWMEEMMVSTAGRLVGVLLLAVLALLSLLGVLVLLTRRNVKKLPSDRSDTLGDRIIRITADGIHTRTALAESFRSWSGVLRLEQTGAYLYLFTDNMSAHIVPLRAFDSPEQAARFAGICRTHWEIVSDRTPSAAETP